MSEDGDLKSELIKQAGFHGLLSIRMKPLKGDLVRILLHTFNKGTGWFELPDILIPMVTPADVRRVYGFRVGVQPVNISREKTSSVKRSAESLASSSGLKLSKKLFAKYADVSKRLSDPNLPPTEFAKLYIIFAISTVLVPCASRQVDMRYAYLLENLRNARGFDWAGLVATSLRDGLHNYTGESHAERAKGDMHLLVVRFPI